MLGLGSRAYRVYVLGHVGAAPLEPDDHSDF